MGEAIEHVKEGCFPFPSQGSRLTTFSPTWPHLMGLHHPSQLAFPGLRPHLSFSVDSLAVLELLEKDICDFLCFFSSDSSSQHTDQRGVLETH